VDGLLPLAGSALAVAALVALCWILGFRGTPRLEGEAEAIALARSVIGDFSPRTVLLSSDARNALLAADNGQLVLVMPHGAHFFARRLDMRVSVETKGSELHLATSHGPIRIQVGESLSAWLDLLRGHCSA
jgi:hypothetical protein